FVGGDAADEVVRVGVDGVNVRLAGALFAVVVGRAARVRGRLRRLDGAQVAGHRRVVGAGWQREQVAGQVVGSGGHVGVLVRLLCLQGKLTSTFKACQALL